MRKLTTSVDAPRQSNMTTAQPAAIDERMLNIKEVADFLRVTPSSIYRLVEKRALRFYRMPRKILFKMADLLEFVEQKKTDKTTEDQYENL